MSKIEEFQKRVAAFVGRSKRHKAMSDATVRNGLPLSLPGIWEECGEGHYWKRYEDATEFLEASMLESGIVRIAAYASASVGGVMGALECVAEMRVPIDDANGIEQVIASLEHALAFWTVQEHEITSKEIEPVKEAGFPVHQGNEADRLELNALVGEAREQAVFGAVRDPQSLVIGTQEDRNTILAALRFYQEHGMGEPAKRTDAIHDIATNGGKDTSYDDGEIDDLCERVNSAAMLPPRLTHASINEAVHDAGIRPTFQQSWKLCKLLDEKPLSHSADHFPQARPVDSEEEAQGATPSLRMRA